MAVGSHLIMGEIFPGRRKVDERTIKHAADRESSSQSLSRDINKENLKLKLGSGSLKSVKSGFENWTAGSLAFPSTHTPNFNAF